jgi:hypothetical protein
MAEIRDYDIALSFAGEQRDYVDRVANLLQQQGVKVFYDRFEEADIWGKNLYEHLSQVYKKRARYTVMFISEAYANKLWTNHERKAAQARAFEEAQEYILPARFDDTEIPGVLSTVGYVSLQDRSPDYLVALITRKLVSSGASVPTELVRRDFSTLVRTQTGPSRKFAVVINDDHGAPIEGAEVILQAENGTFTSVHTGVDGSAEFALNVRRVSTMLASHPSFPAAILEKVDPIGEMKITLPRRDDIGSIAIRRTGDIPGLHGRINPILDTLKRTYLYAENIAVDGGKVQPTNFIINEPFELEDAFGNVVSATVKHIAGDLALMQYTRLPKQEEGSEKQIKPLPQSLPNSTARIEEAPIVMRRGRLSKMPATSSSDLFSQRFGLAFPGLRSAAWFESEEDIANRLGAFFAPPIQFSDGHLSWWFRGSSCLQIENFMRLSGRRFLMNIDELNIRRICAVHEEIHYRCWIYVQTQPDQSTGVYPRIREELWPEKPVYISEEYGLVDDGSYVTRAEYDDGATVVAGRPISLRGRAQLRARYLTPYNLILAPNDSPINNINVEERLEGLLDALLRDEDVFDEMAKMIRRLPRRPNR